MNEETLIEISEEEYKALVALARRTLWIAYSWNDHNFEHPLAYARREASSAGIKSFEEANNWLEKVSADRESKIDSQETIDARNAAGAEASKIAYKIAHTARYYPSDKGKDVVEALISEIKELHTAVEKLAALIL